MTLGVSTAHSLTIQWSVSHLSVYLGMCYWRSS